MFPVPVFNVPATLTPVPVTVTMLELPATLTVTLPLADGIFKLLLPFDTLNAETAVDTFPDTLEPVILVNKLPLPLK